MEDKKMKVCVTGGAGYIASWLVMKLLDKGYTVHATLRNLDDPFKVGLLKSFPNAEGRLRLFEADIYNPGMFEPAIEGCDYVFHVATPMQHNNQSSEFKNTSEAAIAGVKSIVGCCLKSGTVKRLIYTASVMSASPIKEDGAGFKDSIDESCWTPAHFSFMHGDDFGAEYTDSKTLAEKEVLSYNGREEGGLEVVSLTCGLVVGDTVLPYLSGSQETFLSLFTGKTLYFNYLELLQEMLGSVPLVHIEDVCEAHIFSMIKPSMNGRFLCSNSYPTIAQIVNYYQENYRELGVAEVRMEGQERGIKCGSTKLIDMGFEYKYDLKQLLDDVVACARKLGVIK